MCGLCSATLPHPRNSTEVNASVRISDWLRCAPGADSAQSSSIRPLSALSVAARHGQPDRRLHAAQRSGAALVDAVHQPSHLQLCDLAFYYSPIHHVAIYVGDNKAMQAPGAGDYLRMSDVDKAGPINSYGRPA